MNTQPTPEEKANLRLAQKLSRSTMRYLEEKAARQEAVEKLKDTARFLLKEGYKHEFVSAITGLCLKTLSVIQRDINVNTKLTVQQAIAKNASLTSVTSGNAQEQ